jgi:hypothetical protein
MNAQRRSMLDARPLNQLAETLLLRRQPKSFITVLSMILKV